MRILALVAASVAAGAIAVPAAAQTYYPQPAYPQYQYPQQAYPQGYGYPQQGYAQPYAANPLEQIVNQLLGNRYSVNDRTQVSRCASVALAQAQRQYGGTAYRQPYGYNQQYNQQYGYGNANAQMRVTAITQVQRRSNNGLRVTGLISSGAYAQPYGNAYGYQGQGNAQANLSFRCNVDYRGAVTGVRISRAATNYRR